MRVNNYYNIVTYWKDGVIISKQCSKCGTIKPANEFGFKNKKKGTLHSKCKECEKRYCEENKEKILKRRHKNYEKNKERDKENNRKWKKNNPERMKELGKKYALKRKEQHISEITTALQQINPILNQLNIKAYGSIYKITNTKTGRCYIGQTENDLMRRYRKGSVKRLLKERKEKTTQRFLEELTNEHDFVIETIDYGICRYHLDKLEVYYINKYDSYNNGYNNHPGNHNTDDGIEDALVEVYDILEMTHQRVTVDDEST